ncbi:hypothetical protein CK203_033803 [Vitis vinifera]|uniref:Uncharacterized protein n=1 Tax=Vitis vinifera TaxID=29760 RepID=A0A438IQC7_VITVI|nr:hypothetical protein CK203_033803 [Vitis vinifera]
MVSEHWFHFPQNHIQVFKTGIKQIQDPLMDPKQNNNNNLNIEGAVHAPWRHAVGAVQGVTSRCWRRRQIHCNAGGIAPVWWSWKRRLQAVTPGGVMASLQRRLGASSAPLEALQAAHFRCADGARFKRTDGALVRVDGALMARTSDASGRAFEHGSGNPSKAFLDQIANRFAANEKVETSTILSTKVRVVGRHTRALGLDLSAYTIQSIQNQLQYTKGKWTLNELIAQCVQEEERLKQEKIESAHLASTILGIWYQQEKKEGQ